MKTICGILSGVDLFLLYGIVGSMDMERISFEAGAMLCGVLLLALPVLNLLGKIRISGKTNTATRCWRSR